MAKETFFGIPIKKFDSQQALDEYKMHREDLDYARQTKDKAGVRRIKNRMTGLFGFSD